MSFEAPEFRDQHELLKQEFLSGAITPEELREKLIELDQSTPGRELAIKNIELLNDPEIREWVNQHQEHKSAFDAFVSFTEFHVGQIEARNNRNNIETLNLFKSALNKAEENSPWAIYIEGTIAYLENDYERLKTHVELLPEGKNKAVLRRLAAGLQERGMPDYAIDY